MRAAAALRRFGCSLCLMWSQCLCTLLAQRSAVFSPLQFPLTAWPLSSLWLQHHVARYNKNSTAAAAVAAVLCGPR